MRQELRRSHSQSDCGRVRIWRSLCGNKTGLHRPPTTCGALGRSARGAQCLVLAPTHTRGKTINNNKNKESKYSSLPPEYLFQPVAIETLGPLNASALNFLSEVGRRLTSLSGDPRVSVPAPLNAYTALQLRFDHGLLLFR